MSPTLIGIFFFVSFFVAYSPIYWQRKRIARMIAEDMKKIDYKEWRKQQKRELYIQLFSRLIWGLFLLSGFIFNFRNAVGEGFNLLTIFVLCIGLSFIVWGIWDFRRKIKNIKDFYEK